MEESQIKMRKQAEERTRKAMEASQRARLGVTAIKAAKTPSTLRTVGGVSNATAQHTEMLAPSAPRSNCASSLRGILPTITPVSVATANASQAIAGVAPRTIPTTTSSARPEPGSSGAILTSTVGTGQTSAGAAQGYSVSSIRPPFQTTLPVSDVAESSPSVFMVKSARDSPMSSLPLSFTTPGTVVSVTTPSPVGVMGDAGLKSTTGMSPEERIKGLAGIVLPAPGTKTPATAAAAAAASETASVAGNRPVIPRIPAAPRRSAHAIETILADAPALKASERNKVGSTSSTQAEGGKAIPAVIPFVGAQTGAGIGRSAATAATSQPQIVNGTNTRGMDTGRRGGGFARDENNEAWQSAISDSVDAVAAQSADGTVLKFVSVRNAP